MDLAQTVAQEFGVPILGVIEAGCRQALRRSQSRIVILATAATVQSESYVKTLRRLGSKVDILQQACPLFVPLVEDELFDGAAVELLARRYLDNILRPGDTAILACTHYPFLQPTLEKIYPQVQWVDAGGALLEDPLLCTQLAGAEKGNGRITALFTDRVGSLENKIKVYFERLGLGPVPLDIQIVERDAPISV